jgi:hypothetical protein
MAWDKESKKASDAKYREKNRERIRIRNREWARENAESKKAYYEAHKEDIKIKQKEWREENKDTIRENIRRYNTTPHARLLSRERNRKYRQKHRDRLQLKNADRRNQNRETIRSQARDWSRKNKHKVLIVTRQRRAKKNKCSVPLTANEKERIALLEDTRAIISKETGKQYHIDHILPVNHGGIHHPVNLRILEGSENVAKGHKLLPEAIALASEHFRLYSERVSPDRAWEFVRQLAAGLGLSENDLDALITGKPLKSKPTLEDFML